ncbi:Cryptic loci regulator 2 [Abortiporus biennis]
MSFASASRHPQPILDTPSFRIFWSSSDALAIELKPGFTDANSSQWPPEQERTVDDRGRVNYDRYADSSKARFWKNKLGKILLRDTVIPELIRLGQAAVASGIRDASVSLIDFPHGYRLFIHESQDHLAPRTDPYLHGSVYVNHFRSPFEFLPHLEWIINGQPKKPDGKPDCQCTYCSGKPQKYIHAERHFSSSGDDEKPHRKRSRSRRGRQNKKTYDPIPAKDYTKLNLGTSSGTT